MRGEHTNNKDESPVTLNFKNEFNTPMKLIEREEEQSSSSLDANKPFLKN